MKVNKYVLIAILFFLAGQAATATTGTNTMNLENEKAVDSFLNAETAEARNMLSDFSSQFIEAYSDKYKAGLSNKEIRKLWIIEEGYKRKADKVASYRLLYVFLAVSLLMLLIFLLTFRIYQMQRNIKNLE